jgi:ribonuclease J
MSSLSIFALGGLGEIGMNCLALEQRGELLLVDCGVTFDHRGLGIDVVHPDFDALEPYRDRIAGLFVTHGHEDHIGAIPYLLERFDIPVWAPAHALALVRLRLAEHEAAADRSRPFALHEATVRGLYRVGSFWVEPIRVTHSIADATALAIKTDAGMVIHTGDFKFDATPPDGEAFDIDRIDELGEAGVALLMSDSTNIDASGETGSERGVGDSLHRITAKASGAVVVAMFASNVHRLRMLGEIARHTKRKVVLLGRSVETHAKVARETGYLDWPSDLVHPADRCNELMASQVLAIASGTQGEWRGALSRIARGDHPHFALAAGDTVVISSRTIPGNDLGVFAVMSDLIRHGVKLHTWISDRDVHVSGHATRQEQKRMLELARPRTFIPLHGTLHHLTRHAALASEVGVAQTCVLENGDVATLDEAGVRKTSKVHVGRVHCAFGRAIPAAQLRERVILAGEGVVAVTVVERSVGEPDVRITTRGTIDEVVEASVVASATRATRAALADATSSEPAAERVRIAVRHVFREAIGFRPVTLVTLVPAPAVVPA